MMKRKKFCIYAGQLRRSSLSSLSLLWSYGRLSLPSFLCGSRKEWLDNSCINIFIPLHDFTVRRNRRAIFQKCCYFHSVGFKNCLKLLSMNLTRSKRICMIPCILMFCKKDKKILLIVLASLFSPLKAC